MTKSNPRKIRRASARVYHQPILGKSRRTSYLSEVVYQSIQTTVSFSFVSGLKVGVTRHVISLRPLDVLNKSCEIILDLNRSRYMLAQPKQPACKRCQLRRLRGCDIEDLDHYNLQPEEEGPGHAHHAFS